MEIIVNTLATIIGFNIVLFIVHSSRWHGEINKTKVKFLSFITIIIIVCSYYLFKTMNYEHLQEVASIVCGTILGMGFFYYSVELSLDKVLFFISFILLLVLLKFGVGFNSYITNNKQSLDAISTQEISNTKGQEEITILMFGDRIFVDGNPITSETEFKDIVKKFHHDSKTFVLKETDSATVHTYRQVKKIFNELSVPIKE
ncbi:MAG: hypothetical protein J6U56_02570 [Spirochaetia bacterium]|nr:hypothetical protein [Spirochaetia bacterium]